MNIRKLIGVGILLLSLWLFRPIDGYIDWAFSKRMFAENGELLAAQISSDQQWRFEPIKTLPERYLETLITYEDRRYYYHFGIDPISIGRAAIQNVKAKKIVSGASTITMQTARLSKKNNHRNWKNKIVEAWLALRLEIWNSKEDILLQYSSLAPYGGNVVGIDAASWRYFQKSPEQLTWAESATLAVLPNAPSLIHVSRNRKLLKNKRDLLLKKLWQNKTIDELEYSLSIQEELPVESYDMPRISAHLLHNKSYSSQHTIYTDINVSWQLEVEKLVNRFHQQWSQNNVQNAAVFVVENATGQTKVYQANVTESQHQQDVDMIISPRSSGSILKPFLYAACLDRSVITPNALIPDIPLYISGFHPTNYDKSYQGAVPADEALSKSLNVPFVFLLKEYGVDAFLKVLDKFHFSTINKSSDHYGLSLILGGAEVSLQDLVYAYRDMANILTKQSKNGPFSEAAVYATFEAMREVSRPTLHGNWEKFSSSVPMAWKTGTSYGHRDAWAVGTTPEYTIGVWVGNADGEGRDGIIGVKMAGELLFGVSDILPLSNSWWSIPTSGLSTANICLESGKVATKNCQKVTTKWVPDASLNTGPCNYHIAVWLNEKGERITDNCNYKTKVEKHYFQLAPSQASYFKKNHPSYSELPPLATDCMTTEDSPEAMQFIYPSNHQVILIPRGLNASDQEIIFRAAHQSHSANLYWYIDHQYIGVTEDQHRISASPAPGIHRVTITDEYGSSISQSFEIAYNSKTAVAARQP